MPRVVTEAEVKIDKNIPFPKGIEGRGKKSKYPWKELNVGESFVYGGDVINAQAAATYYNNKTGNIFRARAHNGGVRVWRTK